MTRSKGRRSRAQAVTNDGRASPAQRPGSSATQRTAEGCQTTGFDGQVLIDDRQGHASLKTSRGTYLMLLDPECRGGYDNGRVDDAYEQYRIDPGNGGHLRCDGFLDASVLHVVR